MLIYLNKSTGLINVNIVDTPILHVALDLHFLSICIQIVPEYQLCQTCLY